MPIPQSGLALLAVLLLSIPQAGIAQDTSAAALRQDIRSWRTANEAAVLAELRELLSIPNLASDSVNIRRNADLLVQMLERRGVSARRLEASGSPPAVFGELRVPGATRTVMLYSHYDGQPVDTARWSSAPWEPVLRSRALFDGGTEIAFPRPGERVDPEARVYARSASDDKSPIVAALAALDALQATGRRPSVNIKFFLEGEEEAGSDHLRDMLERHASLLAADVWLFLDGPVHQTRQPQLVFGARGVIGLNLTVYGPIRPLHSGHYGNWAPNPNLLLATLIASMRDREGRILIEGYYSDVRPPTPVELDAIRRLPPVDDALRRDLGLQRTEAGNAPLGERLLLPALNVGGLAGGQAGGGGANVIVPVSRAYIDFRLVPDQRPERVRGLVERHIAAQGFHIVREDPDQETRGRHMPIVRLDWSDTGYPALRTALDLPVSRAVAAAAETALGREVLLVPTSGGSLPLHHFQEVLGAPLITVPIVNHDNNQHAEDENLRLQNLWDGIELFAGLLARLGAAWPGVS